MSTTFKIEGDLNENVRFNLAIELGMIQSKKINGAILITVFDERNDIKETIEKFGLKIIDVLEQS